jgi:hypothetical protein
MAERKHDQWKELPPTYIDHVGKEMRSCDLVVCGECLAVRYIGTAQLEARAVPRPEPLSRTPVQDEDVTGVFCPGCDQLLFDKTSWAEHRSLQRHYDTEFRRREKKGRVTK